MTQELRKDQSDQVNDVIYSRRINNQDFTYVSLLGVGTYGKVYKIQKNNTDINKQYYAVKIINKCYICELIKYRVNLEIDLLYECRDEPYVSKLRYAFEDKIAVYLVLDLYPGGNVYEYINKKGFLEGDRLKNCFAELYSGIKSLHNKNILHRDLKPENLLIDGAGHAVIGDLGVATKLKPEMKATIAYGSLPYVAPEVIKKRIASIKADLWSLGCVMHYIATKKDMYVLPEIGEDLRSYDINGNHILNNDPIFDKLLPKDIFDLIEGLVRVDPVQRIGSTEIENHLYFGKDIWAKIRNRSEEPPFPNAQYSGKAISDGTFNENLQQYNESIIENVYDFSPL